MTIRISNLELYRIPTDQMGPIGASRILVRVETAPGRVGWGDAPMSWPAESIAVHAGAIRSVLVGRSLFKVEELLRLDVLSEGPLRCAVETACWDLIGRQLNQPLINLWGGLYRRRVPLTIRIAAQPVTSLIRAARESVAGGVQSFVLEASGQMEDDLRLVELVRGQLGSQVELRLDGRELFDEATAAEMCEALGPSRLQCFVDPLSHPGPLSWGRLGRQSLTPLAVCRGIDSAASIVELARTGAIDYVGIIVEKVGGPTAVQDCVTVAEAAGIRPFLMSGLSPGPTAAVTVQLAASTAALDCCNEMGYSRLQDDLLAEPIVVTDGMVHLPEGNGLGVEIDLSKLERWGC
jgi:L-alanine-DL-glutamate epimerase-like enolase superfamily enzyme